MTDSECYLRPLNCDLNHLSVPDGSTMFMQGDTAVIAGVYGPVEAQVQKIFHNKANVQVTFGPLMGPPSINSRLMELYLRDTCEGTIITSLYPASTISINIQELQDCGGLLACAINASCLALINSSLAMKFTFAAVCSAVDKDSGKIIIDPNKTQLQKAKATFTFVFESINKDLVSCHSSGQFTEKELMESLNKCKETSQYLFDFYRNIVKKHVNVI